MYTQHRQHTMKLIFWMQKILDHQSGLVHVTDIWLTQVAKFMGPTWGPPGSCRPQMGPMLAPWTLPSGNPPSTASTKIFFNILQGSILPFHSHFFWRKHQVPYLNFNPYFVNGFLSYLMFVEQTLAWLVNRSFNTITACQDMPQTVCKVAQKVGDKSMTEI